MYLEDEFCNPFDGNPENFWMKLEHCGRYLYAYDHIKKTDVVADVSCATGYGSFFLSQKAKLVIGVDKKEIYLDYAKHNYSAPNIYYIPVDLEQNTETLANRNISKIICLETLQHTRSPLEILAQFYEILPDKGELIVSFPNKKYEQFDEQGNNEDHYHLSIIEIKNFLKCANALKFKVKAILGQPMMNDIVSAVSAIQKKYKLSLDELYHYDIESIVYFSRRFAYPSDLDIDESYSYLIHLVK